MTLSDWLSEGENWVFLLISIPTLIAGWKVVSTRNIVRAVLYLVVTLAGTAALFLLLGAEFVGWTVVLVYIGAVIILFLIGIMITRAPLGVDSELSHPMRIGYGTFGAHDPIPTAGPGGRRGSQALPSSAIIGALRQSAGNARCRS